MEGERGCCSQISAEARRTCPWRPRAEPFVRSASEESTGLRCEMWSSPLLGSGMCSESGGEMRRALEGDDAAAAAVVDTPAAVGSEITTEKDD